jgi:undecaprenyl diphosphate synthase
MAGYWKGAETLLNIVRAAVKLGVKVLTVYAFSTENWKRPPLEVNALMRLFKAHLVKHREAMIEGGVRLNIIGNVSKFPADVRKALKETICKTSSGTKMDLVVALNYGARDEIKRAVVRIVEDCINNKLDKNDLSESTISSYLDTWKWQDPDLLIRSSGESRISNFLLWQISYSEIVLTDVLWPDFSEGDLLNAIRSFQKREMRIGR